VEGIGKREDLFPNLRGKAEEPHDLGYPGAGDALLTGDIRLSGDRTGFQESLPLDGLPEEFDHSGGLGYSCGFGVARRDRAYHSAEGSPLPQGANISVFKRPLGPEGDFDVLFAVNARTDFSFSVMGEMDNSKIDLRLDTPRAGSQSVTDGEPAIFRRACICHALRFYLILPLCPPRMSSPGRLHRRNRIASRRRFRRKDDS